MKNVYQDYEIENDTMESVEELDPLPQFKQEKAPKKRRVEYDEHGRKRKDRSNNWIKILVLIFVVVLVHLYAFHTCGADLFGLR
ncbi:MAG: hypothetical protein IJC41_06870 [Firmicutes bacterium]|nr:hypothetical protein [Bacillota bacterium]